MNFSSGVLLCCPPLIGEPWFFVPNLRKESLNSESTIQPISTIQTTSCSHLKIAEHKKDHDILCWKSRPAVILMRNHLSPDIIEHKKEHDMFKIFTDLMSMLMRNIESNTGKSARQGNVTWGCRRFPCLALFAGVWFYFSHLTAVFSFVFVCKQRIM